MQKSLVKFAVLASLLGIGFFAVWQGKDKLGLSLSGDADSISLDDFVDEVPTDLGEASNEEVTGEAPAAPEGNQQVDPFAEVNQQLASNSFPTAETMNQSDSNGVSSDPFNFNAEAVGTSEVNVEVESADPFAAFADVPVQTVSNETVSTETVESEAFDPFAATIEQNAGQTQLESQNTAVTEEAMPVVEESPVAQADPFNFGQNFADNSGAQTSTTTTTTTTTTQEENGDNQESGQGGLGSTYACC